MLAAPVPLPLGLQPTLVLVLSHTYPAQFALTGSALSYSSSTLAIPAAQPIYLNAD